MNCEVCGAGPLDEFYFLTPPPRSRVVHIICGDCDALDLGETVQLWHPTYAGLADYNYDD